MGSVTDSLISDTHTSCLLEVNLQPSCSFMAVPKSHLSDVAILSNGCTVCAVLTRVSNISTGQWFGSDSINRETMLWLIPKAAAATYH